jgi:hypothetical protein
MAKRLWQALGLTAIALICLELTAPDAVSQFVTWTLTDGTHTVKNVNKLTIIGGTVGGTPGAATITVVGGGTGCTVSGGPGVVQADVSNNCVVDGSVLATGGALQLGASGTAGSLIMGNATSGLATLHPPTGALASADYTLPAAGTRVLVARDTTDTLTNKSIDCNSNTCTNFPSGGSTLTANSTATSGFSANQLLYSDGSKLQAATVGSGLSFSGGNLSATGGGAVTGVGVDGGTSAAAVTSTGTTANGTRLEKIGSLSAAITRTLPAISAVSADTAICYDDAGQNITASHTLTITANAADAISGGSTGGSVGPYTASGMAVCLRVSATHNWTVEVSTTIVASSAPSNQFANGIGASGLTYAQPAFSNLSGSIAASQLPNPSSSTLGGVQSKAAVTHQWLNTISTSGVPGSTQPACADISDATALCSTTPGSNVATAAAAALSAAGGLTSTIASGTSAMGTSAIGSGACATVVTTTATNTATTDVVLAGFNGDPTGVTGYAPTVNGMLSIISYPSSGNVNFKVCNNTSASITPGAITLNWRILR